MNSSNQFGYTCQFCRERFNTSGLLMQHLGCLVGLDARMFFTCCQCFKCVSTKHVRMHSKHHGGEQAFTCDVCLLSLSDKLDLRKHRRNIHPDVPYFPKSKKLCLKCGKLCSDMSFRYHLCLERSTTIASDESQGKDVANNEPISIRTKQDTIKHSTGGFCDSAPYENGHQKICQSKYGQEPLVNEDDTFKVKPSTSISSSETERNRSSQSGNDLEINDIKGKFVNQCSFYNRIASTDDKLVNIPQSTSTNVASFQRPFGTSPLMNEVSSNEYTEDVPGKFGAGEYDFAIPQNLESRNVTGLNTSPISGSGRQELNADTSDSTDHVQSYAGENVTVLRNSPYIINPDYIWICDNCPEEFKDRKSYFSHTKRCKRI